MTRPYELTPAWLAKAAAMAQNPEFVRQLILNCSDAWESDREELERMHAEAAYWKRNALVVEQAANAWADDARGLQATQKDLVEALRHEIGCEWCSTEGCQCCDFGCTSAEVLKKVGTS